MTDGDSTTGYTLGQAQASIRDALARSDARHARWRALETLYRTGSLAAAHQAEAGNLETFDLAYEVVNMTLPHINVIAASTVSRDPVHLCVPFGGGPEAEDYAATCEGVLAYFWQRARGTVALKLATLDMVKLGDGFLKVGWHHAERERDATPLELEERMVGLLEDDYQQAQLGGWEPTDPEVLADQVQTTTTLVDKDEPFVEYVSPFDVFAPPNAVEIESCRWVAHRVSVPKDEVQANDAFDNVDDLRVDSLVGADGSADGPAEWVRRARQDGTGTSVEVPDETVTLWEFYDLRARRLLVFQIDAAEPLYDDELPYAHRYPPFVHLRNYTSSGTDFWGFGDVENIANLQQMLNELFSMQVDNARRSGNKTLYDKRAVSEALRAGLEDDTGDVAIPVDVPNGKALSDIIMNVERKGLSSDVYAAKEHVEQYLRLVLGINDFQAGGVGADRMSATAAAVVDGVASLRAMDKVAEVEKGAAHAGNLILLLCQEFLDEPRAIRVASEVGAKWPKVDRTMIRGEFDVSVEGGSTQAENPHTRENRGLRTLNELVPMLDAAGFDPMPAFRQALRDLGHDPDVMMQPRAPDPAAPPEGGGGGPAPGGGGQQAPESVPGEGAPAAVAVEHGGPPAALEAQMAGGMV